MQEDVSQEEMLEDAPYEDLESVRDLGDGSGGD